MSSIILIARNEHKTTLVQNEVEVFLDDDFKFIGKRYMPAKFLSENMIELVQNTVADISIKLIRPNGLALDLTGNTAIRLGIFQQTPIQQQVALKAGSAVGALTDGLVKFSLTQVDNNFVGFAVGHVIVTKPSGNIGFEQIEFKYSKNPLP